MKNKNNQESILTELLNKLEPTTAPDSLKSQVLNSIYALSPEKSYLQKDKPSYKIWIPVLVVVVFCLGWSLAQIEWSGWSLPELGLLTGSQIDWEFSDKISNFSKNLPNLSLPSGNWKIYLGGGIIVFWLFVLLNSVLNRFSNKH